MKKITEEVALEECEKEPRRKCFHNNSGVQKRKQKPTFSVHFECVKKIFEMQTGFSLDYNANPGYKSYWKFVTPEEINLIEKWERTQGTRVFLRDCLSLSIALDLYKEENQDIASSSGKYTLIGKLVKRGKEDQDLDAINQLAEAVAKEINDLPFYKDADLVCAVPSYAKFDLPRSVTSSVIEKIGKQNITDGFAFGGPKESIKNLPLREKWKGWEEAKLSFNSSEFDVNGKTIILIDDKYQSGITTQYVAMKLQEAGANQIYSLCFVKTWSNTDNIRNVDNK